ncbi:MAG: hypothetical protein GF311_21740 [Candidatus Lokiarchaeota archaeon]|nr:hypothetical protein [Candidatus Lokiarchaeota archaeon]
MLVDDIYNYVLTNIDASHDKCKRIRLYQNPSKRFIIGSLADISKDFSVGSPTGESEIQSKTALRHNSLSIIFLVKKDSTDLITISPSCSVFYKVFPTYEEQHDYFQEVKNKDAYENIRNDPGFVEIWKRLDCKIDSIQTQIEKNSISLDFSNTINEILNDEETLRTNKDIEEELKNEEINNHFNPEWLESKETYIKKLAKIKEKEPRNIYNWEAEISLEKENFNKKTGTKIITVRFRNTTKIAKRTPLEGFLFNCRLEMNLNSNKLIPFEYKHSYEEYNYVENEYLRTLNCHAKYLEEENLIITKPYGLFYQQKKVPRTEIDGIKAKFEYLKSSLETLDTLLEKLTSQYKKFTTHEVYKNENHPHHHQFVEETKNFKRIIKRYSEGIEILNSNINARRAFFLMNQVFETVSEFNSWRLFQIVFIVMMLPDIVDLKSNRDIADILHVDTGGGKSEAYFGIVVFLLFWDRLRGKTFGISAITKFPLRMLSIQQLQRIAKIIMIAENVRKKEEIEGEVFSVGYYVGITEEFPRYNYDVIQNIKKSKKNGKKIKGLLMDICPLCGANVNLDIIKDKQEIIHKCEGCSEQFFLYFTNGEIYRFIPSFIVSTVDKLASVALNRRFKNLMGGKLSLCSEGHGFIPINDKCEVRIRKDTPCDGQPENFDGSNDGPTLMIQDEMHLLREGFGTIDSHFESLLNTLLKELSDKKFKYLSLTATVSGAKNQIDNLYGKDYFIFPGRLPRGFNEKDDIFFSYIEDNIGDPVIQRILIGLKPNLRDNQYASLLTIRLIADFIKEVEGNKEKYSNKYGLNIRELEKELRKYRCLLTYHGRKADVFGMHYFLSTVVTSKLEDFDIIDKTLTGDNTLNDIKQAISLIREFPDNPKNERRLHVTFATNVVSHGVDINNWNIMIFQGMTRNTSEYIQALSRSGRRYTGITFLWFYPNRVRDLSYYKNFSHYHETIQHRVEKTPLSRWTKLGFKQTFTSVFCASILNYLSNVEEKPLYKVDHINNYFEDREKVKNLINFIRKAYYSDYDKVGAQWVKDQISCETERRINYLKKYTNSANKFFFPNALRDCEDPFFKTQYGMRGIQEEVCLRLDDNYRKFIEKIQRRD